MLRALLGEHKNLYLSFTPELVCGKYPGIRRVDAIALAVEYPTRIVLGTTARGVFKGKPPESFAEMPYAEQVLT